MERLESYRVHGGFRAYKLLEDINAELAAEREKVQTLVDALTDAAKMLNEIHVFEHLGDCAGNDCPTFKMAQRLDALAKVKEGKQ
jgi:hypothetical protein